MTDKTPLLVGHANLNRGYLMMVADGYSLSPQHVALKGTRHIHNIILDAESKLSGIVHDGGNGQIGQCEQCAALTDITSVQMSLRHRHLRYGMPVVQFYDTATGIGGKTVVLV